jgi:hypothetical protein
METNISKKFSIYVSPDSDAWKLGDIGEKLAKVSYYTDEWGGPHMTLTSYEEFEGNITLIENDLTTILSNIKVSSKDIDFNNAKLLKTSKDFILITFEPIPCLNSVITLLSKLNYKTKPLNRFHISLGNLDELLKFNILTEDKAKLSELPERLRKYFEEQDWFITISVIDENKIIKWNNFFKF